MRVTRVKATGTVSNKNSDKINNEKKETRTATKIATRTKKREKRTGIKLLELLL